MNGTPDRRGVWAVSPACRRVALAFLRECSDHGQAHGSRIRDLLIEQGAGALAEAGTEYSILRDLCDAGLCVAAPKPWPTTSQAAFLGLMNLSTRLPWGPTTSGHYYYTPGRHVQEVIAPAPSLPDVESAEARSRLERGRLRALRRLFAHPRACWGPRSIAARRRAEHAASAAYYEANMLRLRWEGRDGPHPWKIRALIAIEAGARRAA